MSIMGNLKRLIFGTMDEPVERVPMRALPDPEKTQFSTAGANELQFSDSERLSAQHRAETVLKEFNESLNSANLSKSRKSREHKLKLAREGLVELKELVYKFPFLHLQNMQAVEASIIAVEAETLVLTANEIPDPSIKNVSEVVQSESLASQGKEIESSDMSDHDRQSFNASNEQGALMCIQSCFRVVNESIVIARKSKNLATKISRLGVARNSLREARKQASQFSLKVDGFDAAEAEINRLDEAIRTGAPTEIAGMQQIDVNAEFSSVARNLLIEATALKREKKFIEACEKLREAYSADGAENLMIEDRLRLPMYLQLAGKNDAGWDELNRLYAKYTDQFSRLRIEHQMQIFLRKENNETASNPVREFLRDDNKPQEIVSQTRKTVGDLQSEPMSAWGNDDIITGLGFSATMQLRTPLRVLLRHGEIHTEKSKEPPQIAREMWEGIWCPRTRFSKFTVSTYASDVGPIHAEDYLPFLIAVRTIVETHESIEHRIEKLQKMPILPGWKTYIDKHRGIDGIIQGFFPKFSNLGDGLDTPNRIAAASDETLLAIKGIGPAKLKALRERCAGITENRDADRLDCVLR
ncbi:MAG: hypothetical protein Q8L93_06760 [Rhodocyclaceae bacterium]|nr:hypothetical protein [Rhodocyclaceae bacterium]